MSRKIFKTDGTPLTMYYTLELSELYCSSCGMSWMLMSSQQKDLQVQCPGCDRVEKPIEMEIMDDDLFH